MNNTPSWFIIGCVLKSVYVENENLPLLPVFGNVFYSERIRRAVHEFPQMLRDNRALNSDVVWVAGFVIIGIVISFFPFLNEVEIFVADIYIGYLACEICDAINGIF